MLKLVERRCLITTHSLALELVSHAIGITIIDTKVPVCLTRLFPDEIPSYFCRDLDYCIALNGGGEFQSLVRAGNGDLGFW